MDDADFVALIERARGGDESALTELLRTFEAEVRTMVRVRLPRVLRTQFDSMDFVQAALTSFCNELRDGKGQFANARHLEAFLSAVVRNKVYEEHRRRTRSKKYDLSREEPFYVKRGDREVPREVTSPDPSPSTQAAAREQLHKLLAGRNPEVAEIVELKIQGLTYVEIGERVGMNERSVRRIIEVMRARMEAQSWR